MKIRSKYQMTANTIFITRKDEVLSDEDFISRLVASGLDRESAEMALKREIKTGALVVIEDNEGKQEFPVSKEEPPMAEPEPEEVAPEEESSAAEPEPEEKKPVPRKPGRPRKKK